MKELSIGDVTYGIEAEDGSRSSGFDTYAEAMEYAGRNAAGWVADVGGVEKVAVIQEKVVGVISEASDKVRRRDPGIGEKLSGLVDELVESFEKISADGKAIRTAGRWTGDVCRMIGMAVDHVVWPILNADVGKDSTFKADGADEARRVTTPLPESIDGRAGRDGDASVVVPEVKQRTKRGEFRRLLELFAMEFVKLALAFYEPRLDGGEVMFECRDFLTAKKRAEAMKRLAGAIEDLSHSGCSVDDVHGAIIAYCNDLGREGLKG